ncbi:hypothetical protein B0T22DRAFT_201665 [Podospora appendiculata]|uniref:C2H2-type domain-containing protein n=1 Tax=Podospora appendiculata TaxID=314037 RepID=A0AAE0X4K6_9PEZI|nr:hypothetical protein B0T22DRAFT_201665 [Podospora appendiculata]
MSQHLQFPRQEHCQQFNMSGPSAHAYSPGSPESLNMDNIGMDMDIAPFASYSMTTQRPGLHDTVRNVQILQNMRIPQSMMQNSAQYAMPQSMMEKFIHDEEESWNPLRGRQPAGLPGGHGLQPDFLRYSETTVPSESGRLQSDSGYGSIAGLTKQSVGNPSIYDDMDHNTDTQSINRTLSELQLPDSISSRNNSHQGKLWNTHGAATNPEDSSLFCTHCQSHVKTKSELNKHIHRHTKPFKCDEAGCARKEGFISKNDLARHKQSVHKADGTKYRCNIDQCAKKTKDWPRADNFRQHLERMHNVKVGLDDLESFISRPPMLENFPSFVSSEATAMQLDMKMQSQSHPQMFLAGLDRGHPGHLASEGGLSKESSLDRVVSLAHFQGHSSSLDELDLTDNSSETASRAQEMNRPFPRFSDSRSHLQGASSTSPREPSGRNPTYPNSDPMSRLESESTVSGEHQEVEDSRSEAPEPVSVDGSVYSPEDGRLHDDKLELTDGSDPMALDRLDQDADCEDDSTSHGENNFAGGFCDPRETLTPQTKIAESLNTPKADNGLSLHALDLSPGKSESLDIDETAYIQKLIAKGRLNDILREIGYQPPKEAENKSKKIPTHSTSQVGNPQVSCEKCSKLFHRPCELKKHLKRHDKPYLCTYDRCEKKFGSKNDWKRHENSQHFQLEYWRCDEKLEDSSHGVCGKVCHRRGTFKTHLETDHQVHEVAEIEKRSALCRVGRNGEDSFWCGLCEKIIHLTGRGGQAATERFDHIDDHINGRNSLQRKPMVLWVEPDAGSSGLKTRSSSESCGDSSLLSPSNFRLAGQPAKARKRRRNLEDNASSPLAKRARASDQGDMVWYCCACSNFWRLLTTNSCLDDGCCHHRCDNCTITEEYVNEAASS